MSKKQLTKPSHSFIIEYTFDDVFLKFESFCFTNRSVLFYKYRDTYGRFFIPNIDASLFVTTDSIKFLENFIRALIFEHYDTAEFLYNKLRKYIPNNRTIHSLI